MRAKCRVWDMNAVGIYDDRNLKEEIFKPGYQALQATRI
jgi:hypothetical protein